MELGVSSLHTVKSPHLTCSQYSLWIPPTLDHVLQFTIEKNPHISGPVHFTPVLLKSQLYLLELNKMYNFT